MTTTNENVESRLRVATLNVWGIRGYWEERRRIMVDGFAAISADVLTLQEVIVTDDYDQAREILGPDYHLAHQTRREPDGQGVTTASRWPIGSTLEVDLHLTGRTQGFACTSLVTEILAPEPFGRIWLVNNLPSWEPDFEHERQLQAVATARTINRLLAERPGHAIVAGDFDADPDATSIRFWTGRHALDGLSVCYRDAWTVIHPGDPGPTFALDNPHRIDWDWPYQRIDYILIRMAAHYGPTLAITDCQRIFDQPNTTASDHYGLAADLAPPPINPS